MTSKLKTILLLQMCVAIYSISGVFSRYASMHDILSFKFILFMGLEVFALGVYAIAWQQVIKKSDISIAYANKATNIFWSMLFAVLLFGEEITLRNIIGVLLIFVGIVVVNRNE